MSTHSFQIPTYSESQRVYLLVIVKALPLPLYLKIMSKGFSISFSLEMVQILVRSFKARNFMPVGFSVFFL